MARCDYPDTDYYSMEEPSPVNKTNNEQVSHPRPPRKQSITDRFFQQALPRTTDQSPTDVPAHESKENVTSVAYTAARGSKIDTGSPVYEDNDLPIEKYMEMLDRVNSSEELLAAEEIFRASPSVNLENEGTTETSSLSTELNAGEATKRIEKLLNGWFTGEASKNSSEAHLVEETTKVSSLGEKEAATNAAMTETSIQFDVQKLSTQEMLVTTTTARNSEINTLADPQTEAPSTEQLHNWFIGKSASFTTEINIFEETTKSPIGNGEGYYETYGGSFEDISTKKESKTEAIDPDLYDYEAHSKEIRTNPPEVSTQYVTEAIASSLLVTRELNKATTEVLHEVILVPTKKGKEETRSMKLEHAGSTQAGPASSEEISTTMKPESEHVTLQEVTPISSNATLEVLQNVKEDGDEVSTPEFSKSAGITTDEDVESSKVPIIVVCTGLSALVLIVLGAFTYRRVRVKRNDFKPAEA